MKPYYYIYNTVTKVMQKTNFVAEAREISQTLATRNPGRSIEILQCIGITSTPDPKPSTFWLNEAERSEVKERDKAIRDLRENLKERDRVIKDLNRVLEKRPLPL